MSGWRGTGGTGRFPQLRPRRYCSSTRDAFAMPREIRYAKVSAVNAVTNATDEEFFLDRRLVKLMGLEASEPSERHHVVGIRA